MPLDELISMMRQGTVQGSRSTVMTPLAWAMAIPAGGLLLGPWSGSPTWLLVLFGSCFSVLALGYLGAYAYFARTNPEALRTERYSLTKLAIEHHLRGDDLTGITQATELLDEARPGNTPALPTPDAKPAKPRTARRDKSSEGPAS